MRITIVDVFFVFFCVAGVIYLMGAFNGKFPPPRPINPASFLMGTLQRKGLRVTGLSKEERMRPVRNNETSHLIANAIFFVQWAENPKADDLITFETIAKRLEAMSA